MAGFSSAPDDTDPNLLLTAAGWIKITISGTDYYVPAWTKG
jgi:hypothetical protein